MKKPGTTFGSRDWQEPERTDAAPLVEQRSEPREPQNLKGLCQIDGPPYQIDCRIIDMSSSGARLQFASTAEIPPTFKVYVEALNVVLECRTVWRNETTIGVEQTIRSTS